MLSAAKLHGGVNPNLAADRQQLVIDMQKYNTDLKNGLQTLASDRAKIVADRKAIDFAGATEKAQLLADTKSMITALKADSEASKSVRDQWQPIIQQDLAAIIADAGDSTQLALDKAQLDTDRASFTTAMAPYEAQTQTDIAHWTQVLSDDRAAVDAARQAAVDQVSADEQKLRNDSNSLNTLLNADRAKILADMQKIKKDGGKVDIK
jgi:hypothetical protein